MKNFFHIIFISFSFSVSGQVGPGFYTGDLKLIDFQERFKVQLDIMEDSSGLSAVFRARIIDNQEVAGCDLWMTGKRSGNRLEFFVGVPLRITRMPDWICASMHRMVIDQKKSKAGEPTEWTGVVYQEDGTNMARFSIQLTDSVNSASVVDEMEEAKYLMNERLIFFARTDSARINLMLAGRGIQILDSLVMDTTSSVLRIEAPGADLMHRLTVLINDRVVLLNNAPSGRGSNIRLKNLEETDLDILLLCYHFMVNTQFNVKLTLEQGEKVKVWEVPVSTYKNRGIRLKVRNRVGSSSD